MCPVAAWIRLFGFSFTLVLLSVLPRVISAVVLVYPLARRATLSRRDGLFVAMLTALSTPFLLLTPPFMSDVPAFCFSLACWYGFTRAAEAAERTPARTGEAVAWLMCGTLAGLLGGTIRQPVWFAPITSSAAWRPPCRRTTVIRSHSLPDRPAR